MHSLQSGEHVATLGRRGEGQGEFFFPTFVSLAPGGGVLVADTMNARVQQLDDEGAFVRQFGERGDQFGQFDKPKGIATDSFGNVYVVDSFFSVVQIFNREGNLLLFFGGRGDSPGFLSNPAGIAINHNGTRLEALVLNPRTAKLHEMMPYKAPPDMSRFLLSPMPGLLVDVSVQPGQKVQAGERLVGAAVDRQRRQRSRDE